jgi:hypothetical protein
MGWDLCSDAHSPLWSLAGALLVSSTREAVECPMFTDHLYRFSLLDSLLAALSHPI